MTDGTQSLDGAYGRDRAESERPFGLPRWAGALLPLLLLVVLVGAVFAFPPFGGVQYGEPLPERRDGGPPRD